jgi:hypothetical protein
MKQRCAPHCPLLDSDMTESEAVAAVVPRGYGADTVHLGRRSRRVARADPDVPRTPSLRRDRGGISRHPPILVIITPLSLASRERFCSPLREAAQKRTR